MPDFKREERFIALKWSNVHECSPHTQGLLQTALHRVHDELKEINIQQLPCVVVESDWPEYEVVWSMIEQRCDPTRARLTPAELTKHWRDRYLAMKAHADKMFEIASELKRQVDAELPSAQAVNRHPPKPQPEIVCLCGSTKFYDAFQFANYRLTMGGFIVLSVGFYPHSAEQAHGEDVGCSPDQKQALDELHKRKIDLADSVFVLNVGGYIGESTASEIEYAKQTGKHVTYLEPDKVS